jgi:hypothetical protein
VQSLPLFLGTPFRSAALQVAHRLDDNYGFLHRKEMDLSIFIGKVFDEAMTINGYF